jgi:hypothetical protein
MSVNVSAPPPAARICLLFAHGLDCPPSSVPHSIYLVGSSRTGPKGVEPVSFASLAVQERQHLEEWIVQNPDLLGEPLLILTKEFDRFDRSDRRLDLLALDKAGTLVVIELKLDIAHTLADQQAIRYAAFCSTMTMTQAVEEFTRYNAVSQEEAENRVREFLDVDELPELNNRPRIILAAGSIDDTELTSCVLWLRGYGVDITCVELTPYRLPDRADILVVPRVIIPLPEAKTFLVSVEQKEATVARNGKEKETYASLWTLIADEFNKLDVTPPFKATGGMRNRYFQIRFGGKARHYEWQLKKDHISVALHFESPDGEENAKWLYRVRQHVDEIGDGISTPLRAEPWGRRWASVSFDVPYTGEPDRDIAQRCAQLMKVLIERTYSIVKPTSKTTS